MGFFGFLFDELLGDNLSSNDVLEKEYSTNKKRTSYDTFYDDLDAGEYDDDPDILREEDPDVYNEYYRDDSSYCDSDCDCDNDYECDW